MITQKKLLLIWLMGSMSGFTIMISGNTLNFWLSKEGVDIKVVGIFALISLPYAINFLWAPIFDTKNIPLLSKFLGRRESWIVFIQILLSISVYYLSEISPLNNMTLFATFGLIVSVLASAQDTILGAFRAGMVNSSKQGEISGIYIFGYRAGMLISSSFAIYISSYISWNMVYKLFSAVILIFPILLLFTLIGSNESSLVNKAANKSHDKFYGFGNSKYLIILLVFLILYRLPDNFITTMINPFLLHVGYNEFEISTAGKFFGITSAIIGGLIASIIMKYFDIFRSLLWFGILHAFAHLLFIIQEIYGKNLPLFFFVTGFESITGGMTMAAYIGYVASLCKGKFKATQYAFLSSMMGISRSILPALSGYIVTMVGWKMFYLFTSIATIPSLLLVLYLKKYSSTMPK